MLGRNTSLFAEIQNIYNHQSVIEYSWDQKGVGALRREATLPVVGINIEF
jgi:hypothetical protein